MRRYLIVDDNVEFAENVAEIIRDGGHEASVAASGSAAIDLARRERFDAVVTDLRMPVMDGARLVDELRQIDPELPAIVMTAFSRDGDILRARKAGVLAILAKPPSIPELLLLLETARRPRSCSP